MTILFDLNQLQTWTNVTISILFDAELKGVYFRPQLFFRSGTLAKLEEQRDEQTRRNITLFQAACSGYLARQAFKKREVGMTTPWLHGHPVSCYFLECTCQRRKSGFKGINGEGDRDVLCMSRLWLWLSNMIKIYFLVWNPGFIFHDLHKKIILRRRKKV